MDPRVALASAALAFAAGCGGARTETAPERRECVPPPEPAETPPAPLPSHASSRVRATVRVPERRIEEEVRAQLPGEISGRAEGRALFARWEAEWRVRPTGRPDVAITNGALTVEADARAELEGRLGQTRTSCSTNVHVRVEGRLRLRPDWAVALENPRARTTLGECRLRNFPVDISGVLQPTAEREVQRALDRATAQPWEARDSVRAAWEQASEPREIGPLRARLAPESIAIGTPTCSGGTCRVVVEMVASPEAWIGHRPEPEPARSLPEARTLEPTRAGSVELRSRLHLSPRALGLLATLPDAEGEGSGTRTAELRLAAGGPFVTIRDADGRGLAHVPIDAASREDGLFLGRGEARDGLAWPDRDDPCLGPAGRRLLRALARPRRVDIPGANLLELVPEVSAEGLEIRHEVRGVEDGMLVVDVVARARRVLVDVPDAAASD